MRNKTFANIFGKVLLGLWAGAHCAHAAMNYQLDWVTTAGGAGTWLGGNYSASITVGQAAATAGMGTAVHAEDPSVGCGYWALFMGTTSTVVTNPPPPPPGPALVITPTGGFVSGGAVGGPFLPTQRFYDVSNSTDVTINYTSTASANWFSITPTYTLFAHSSVTVAVQLTTNAQALQVGDYTGMVTFASATSTSTIPVTLAVGRGMVVSGPTTFETYGYIGGPFYPPSITNEVRNATTSPMTWSASLPYDGDTWVTLSQTGGTLAPGEATTVVASVGPYAYATTSPGGYGGCGVCGIAFTNLTSGLGNQLHPVWLSVNHRFSISPDPIYTNLFAGGFEGGPFSPQSLTFVLSNTTASAQSWTASHNYDWLAISSPSGTLAPRASTNVTLSIGAAANTLPAYPNAYSDSVKITSSASPYDSYTLYASLYVRSAPPQIVSQPGHHTVSPGSPVTLSVGVTGSQPISYQWLHDGVEIPGATTNGLTLPNVSAADVGHYTVNVRNRDYWWQSSDEGTLALLSLKVGAQRVLTLSGSVGDKFRIDCISSLSSTTWQVLSNLTMPSTTYSIADKTTAAPQRFYRAVYQP
jgi:hypothetical protein